jgi:hypothetical protein
MVKPKTYGRMGNFLFQVATAIGYAKKHGLAFSIPNLTSSPTDNPIYLQHLVNPDYNPFLKEVVLHERGHGYQEQPFDERWRGMNIILDGYWQSEKYFKDYRAEVLDLFGYPWELKKDLVSIHVRRGDYLVLTKKHPPVPKEWIERAMLKFPGCKFLFFSDDIDWCWKTFGQRDDCLFSRGLGIEQDLISMSQCEHHICSASTFSWWGAWLSRNPTKHVVIPQHWFNPGYKGLETKDIVPAEWEKMGDA